MHTSCLRAWPELFAYLRCTPGQKKAFLKGLEGAHQGFQGLVGAH